MADQGKGWGRKLLGSFVELDEAQTAAPQPTPGVTAAVPAATPVSLPTGPVVDPAIMQHLQGKVMARRTPFVSLLEAAQKLEAYIPDQSTRLKAAATTNGGDKSSILSAIDVHLNDLDAEAGNFKRFTDGEAQTKVNSLVAEAERCESSATAADARVQQLQAEIQSLQAKASEDRAAAATARSNASAEQADLERKSSAFVLALNTAKAGLNQQKQLLAQVL